MPEWTTLKRMIWLLLLRGASAVIRTVTGTAPLVLENAIAAAINSLKQYGKCTQASTPTPSAPADIMCNNGTIKARHQSGLPLGYQKLDYVVGRVGQTVVDTGVSGSLANLRIVFRGKKTSHTAYSPFFGNYRDENTNVTRIIEDANSRNPILFTYNRKAGGGSVSAAGVFSDDAHTYDLSSSGLLVDNDKSFAIRDVSGASNSTNIAICSSNVPVSAASSGASTVFAYFKMYQGETLIRDYVPVKRLSDNKVGFYELVNDTFEPGLFSSTYAFTAGSPVDDPVEIYIDGTPEVLSVGGKNLNGGTVEHKGYTSTGGESTSTTFAGTLWKIPCAAGQKFTVSWGGFPDGVSGVFINTWLTDGSWNTRQAISASTSLTYTIGAGVGEVNFTLYKTGGVTIGDNAWIQVEYGGTATDYQPFVQPQTVTDIPMLLSAGDYADEGEIISGGVTHKCGVYVFTGDESVSASGAGWSTPISDRLKSKVEAICTHYPYSSATMANAPDKSFVTFSSQNVGFKDSSFNSAADVKAFFASEYAAGHPVIVIYPLAEETQETVTPQPLATFMGTNIVSVTSNVSPVELEVEYSASV